MRRPTALNLIRAEHRVAIYCRRSDAGKPLVEAGAHVCANPAEVASTAEVVLTMVTTSEDVTQVAFIAGGIVKRAAPGLVLVDMSTISPGVARDITTRIAAHGVDMLDVPVSGGREAPRTRHWRSW